MCWIVEDKVVFLGKGSRPPRLEAFDVRERGKKKIVRAIQ